ncbi:hypothetical protein ACHAWF_012655 [Thalassiosira exigua]
MKAATRLILPALSILSLASPASSFFSSSAAPLAVSSRRSAAPHLASKIMSSSSSSGETPQSADAAAQRHPHCDLPGDPSLILTTNVDLGDDKGEILKALSALVATSTGKPESYVAVCVTDNASMVFGGSDAPLALGCVYSLGAINMANNGKIQSGVTDALEKYGVTEDRIYINFFDMPRDCVGWNRATFAG